MNYFCCHCGANLDLGDVFQHFYNEYNNDYTKAIQTARSYGWSEKNQLHFTRTIIVQKEQGKQFEKCPDCNNKDPFVYQKKNT